ncbi:uncharacterized protein CLUP02_18132 [Colletotrichum lupini]|uniref:Uncharacterized protein n=1 Tax=Colletotrichum lupini TaxID=145971 RepID=A0A9Q8SG33_9PEZI|nr:uncharacterized protein CLUP02_18132 [Colletotrichum lupini]UQC76619.1 hypothetical protein CLUP02_18132 [Colletotrichum lupini]
MESNGTALASAIKQQEGEGDTHSLASVKMKWYTRLGIRGPHGRRPACRYPYLKETRIDPGNPKDDADTNGGGSVEIPLYEYINFLRQSTVREEEWVNYLSAARFSPRKMEVQTSSHRLDNDAAPRDWLSQPLRGHAPLVVQLSRWAVKPLMSTSQGRHVVALLRALLVALPILILMLWPGNMIWHTSNPLDGYEGFVGHHWNWPKFTINELDMKPGPPGVCSRQERRRELDVRNRLEYPKKLLIRSPDGVWKVTETNHLLERPKYLFISHIGSRDKGEEPHYRKAAQALAETEGFDAIFLDESCFIRGIRRRVQAGQISEIEGQRITDYDIYTLCDVVRGSSKVAFIYPNPPTPMDFREEWGKRMWTFLEGLLAPGNSILFCPWDYENTSPSSEHSRQTFRKVELASRCWGIAQGQTDKEGGNSTRILAEHFAGLLTLTPLELLPLSMHALSSRNAGNQNSLSDMAYAAMGLLRYRIERDRDASFEPTLFQTLAHLSLKNDSDKIIDRIISLLPRQRLSSDIPRHSSDDMIWTSLCEKDSFGTLVHHITPLCEVVGVAEEDQTVFLDGCHAINIRWKDFPRIKVHGGQGGAKKIVIRVMVLGSAALMGLMIPFAVFAGAGHAASENLNSYSRWFRRVPDSGNESSFRPWMGLGQAIDRFGRRDLGDSNNISTAMLALAIICSVSAYLIAVGIPFIVHRFLSGTFLGCSPCLVGFEGVMPIREVEERIFGIHIGRLRYASSASHLFTDERDLDPEKRWYQEGKPSWIEGKGDSEEIVKLLKKGQRVFTLVDLGTLSVIVFAAERPPSVALLTGREGGMLRAVLCSWSFRNDCLYKEAVVRMPSSVLADARPTSWVKLCIRSLDEARQTHF